MASRFCNCRFPSSIEVAHHRGPIPDLVSCRCAEEDGAGNVSPWKWHVAENSENAIVIDQRDIIFHPICSKGTAIVRGTQALKAGMVHCWEMLVMTPLVGTDVMVGIGTDKVNLGEFSSKFSSALGSNGDSWGYSYTGRIQHCGKKSAYGQEFGQGCLIGVSLDRSRGHLEFYVNRRPLGVAYTNVPVDQHVNIYPMVSSTDYRSFQVACKQTHMLAELRELPGFKSILGPTWLQAMFTK